MRRSLLRSIPAMLPAALSLAAIVGGCATTNNSLPRYGKKDDSSSFSSTVKRWFGGGDSSSKPAAVAKKPAQDDPISLQTPVTPNASLYASVAQVQERSGNLEGADQMYKRALSVDSKSLDALLGSARVLDRQGKTDEAMKLYTRAISIHPKAANAHNDLALCYARQKKLDQAAEELTQAVALSPKSKLYRNNLAAILVDLGRSEEAYEHLVAAHGKAIAHYNLGFLLAQKGDGRRARGEFTAALKADPSMIAAEQWLQRIDTMEMSRSQIAGRPSRPEVSGRPEVSNRPDVSNRPGISRARSASATGGDRYSRLPEIVEPRQGDVHVGAPNSSQGSGNTVRIEDLPSELPAATDSDSGSGSANVDLEGSTGERSRRRDTHPVEVPEADYLDSAGTVESDDLPLVEPRHTSPRRANAEPAPLPRDPSKPFERLPPIPTDEISYPAPR